jgi:FHA domain-containing protein/zinc ribbon protein
MIFCQQCYHELPDGTMFCDLCGTSLIPEAVHVSVAPPLVPAALAPLVPAALAHQAPAAAPARPPVLPPFLPDSDALTPSTPPQIMPRPFRAPRTGDAVSFANMEGTPRRVRLRLSNGKAFELSGKAEYLIGRRDPGTNTLPDVDLADWNGAASGVSREHAAIYVGPDGVFIEDRESLNETIRNDFRLLPRQLYPLKDGDELRLGTLMLLVVIS